MDKLSRKLTKQTIVNALALFMHVIETIFIALFTFCLIFFATKVNKITTYLSYLNFQY